MDGYDFTPKIQSVREVNGIGANNMPEVQMLVTFLVGEHGPFTKTFPRQHFDPIAAKAELVKFADQLRTLAS